MITNSIKAIDKERQKILSKIYVSNVKNRLREMDTPPETDCKRWIWELMQNAKDSISGSDRKEVNIKLEVRDNVVIFQHDGCPFNGKTYLALLYKYSEGKSQNAESTGRFGTGFLTTHCLSKTVNIDGPIINCEEGQNDKIIRFNVTMYRDGKTDQELISALERMEKEKLFFQDEFTKWTKYTYTLKTEINKKASKLGLENFKQNIIKTMLFNTKFKSAELETDLESITIKDESDMDEVYDKVQIKKYSVYNKDNKLYTVRLIYIKIEKPSEKLSKKFNTERNLHLEACVEINENNEIIFRENSPCLFCSLPLVGSERHILPIILNTNDFEPSTERQEIILNGEETNFEDGEYISTDVGINKYILNESKILFKKIIEFSSENNISKLYRLLRGLKEIPKVEKYFDPEWYYEKYILPMRDIISNENIVTMINQKKDLINNTFFPIYRKKEDFLSYEEKEELKDSKELDERYNNYLKEYHRFCKIFFKEVPEFNESVHWSKYLWKEGLENKRITINMLIEQYQKQNLDFEVKNEFIKFIWDYYKELLQENKILINQNNEFILYYNDFAEAKSISEDMVECLEELGENWKERHLHNKIISIELPSKHEISYAEKLIREKIKLNQSQSFILAKYINKNDEERILFHSLIKKIFRNKVEEIKFVENFNNEIWTESDNFIINEIIKNVASWKYLNKIPYHISLEDFNSILNYLYLKRSNCFKNNRLLPSNDGEFKIIDELKLSEKINIKIKNFSKMLDIYIDKKILNEKIEIKDLNIEKYTLDELIQNIAKTLKNTEITKKIALEILKFIPTKDHSFYKEIKDIKDIYMIYFNEEIYEEIIVDTKIESFWVIIKEKIMKYIQSMISKENKINDNKIEKYVEMINQYNQYFDFQNYYLLPNIEGKLKTKSQLLDYSDIPRDIIEILSKSDNYFNEEIMHFGLEIEINKKNILEFSETMNNIIFSIENKREEQKYKKYRRNYYYDYHDYDSELNKLCKMVIRYIPDDDELAKYQKKIYKIYNVFEVLEEQKTIFSCEQFYKNVNKLIINFINKKLENLGKIEKAFKFVGDYIKFIEENQELLHPNKYAILPNLNGDFKKLSDLKKNDGIYPQLLDIIKNFKNYEERFDLYSVLMDDNITIEDFLPKKSVNNNDISKLINELIKLNILKPAEILKILPIKENLLKQQEIIFIYEKVFKTELNTYQLELEASFWDIANEAIISKVIKKIEKKNLKSINDDEKIAIEVLEKIYNYKNPRTRDAEDLAIVPNQNGDLKIYSQLFEEENISENFKIMLQENFNYNLNYILKHNDITLKFENKLKIDGRVIDIIELGIKNERSEELKLKKAKALIKFYPKIKEDNRIKKFGECFKLLSGENYEMEKIETNHATLWEKCIPILTNYILKLLNKDKNIENLCKRTNIKEDKIFDVLNDFYLILEKKKYEYKYIPNENNDFVDELFVTEDIDNDLKEALRLLNENEDYSKFLLNSKINKNIFEFPKKEIKDIAIQIDKNIKKQYKMYKNDRNNEFFNIDNFKKACEIIITKWLPEHCLNKDYSEYFEYTLKKILDILMDVLLDEEDSKSIKDFICRNPLGFTNYLSKYKFSNQSEEKNIFEDKKINEEKSIFEIKNINENHEDNGAKIHEGMNVFGGGISFGDELFSFGITKDKKYEKNLNYIGQAYVFEKLCKEKLFKDIKWLNKSEEKTDDEIFTPSHYYIKDQILNYEIEITSISSKKTYYIKVKCSIMPNEKFNLFLSRIQWSNLRSFNNNYIFALVCLEDKNDPEIAFIVNNKLENL